MATVSERDRIVDCAVELAEQSSWEAVRLREIAARLNIPLDDIRTHFREKEEIADAFFDRADRAMLAAARAPGFGTLTTREKLERLVLAWLDALAPRRRAARGMLLSKLEPGHLHVSTRRPTGAVHARCSTASCARRNALPDYYREFNPRRQFECRLV